MALQALAQFGCVNQGTVQGFASTLILASVGIATSCGAAASGGFSGGSSVGAIGVVGGGGIAIAIGGLIA